MALNTFFEQFDLLADAPDGVQKLRKLILQMAVQGKLMPHDPGDEPASILLEKVKLRKEELTTQKIIKKDQIIPIISQREALFELPQSWKWERLGNLARFIDYRGKTPQKTDCGIKLITAKNVRMGFINDEPEEYISEETYTQWMTRGFPRYGDILFTTEAPLGNVAMLLTTDKVALAQRIIDLQVFAGIFSPYLMISLMSPALQASLQENATGMTAQGIKSARLKLILIPVPPLAEQKRIVAKVNQLMSLCDRLEEQQQQRRSHCIRLGEGATTQLLNAKTPDEFNQHWSRVCNNFDLLYSLPESVPKLRQAILQLAVQGKLVPQDPEDEPGILALKHIEEEKEKLIEQGRLRRSKKLFPLKPETSPFPLPRGWLWIYVQDAGEVKLGRQRSPKDHFGPYMVPYLRVANVLEAQLNLSDIKEMNFSPKEQEIFRLRYGDILLNEGQSYELIGRPALYRNEIPGACFQNTLLRFRPFSQLIPEYALIVFRTYMHFGRFRQEAQQTTNIAHLSAGRLSEIEFPLPPLAEQKRIVAKVDRLMSLCDQLEAQLAQAQGNREKLMEAAVRQVLAV